MNKQNQYAVIMAGGIGSRFWPVSKTSRPKQFIDILGTGKTLIQQTYERLLHSCPKENIYIVTNELYRPLINEQLPEIDNTQILGEPSARNTAPCVAYASYKIAQQNPDAITIVAPSDHLILKEEAFTRTVQQAFDEAAAQQSLITLGIVPTRPDTGYGYIQYKKEADADSFYKVKTFTEKPNLELAKTFIASGDFLWNAGIFIWSVKAVIKAIEMYLPDMAELFQEGKKHYFKNTEADFIKSVYSQCTNISIDFGIMEKAKNVYVKPADFGWSDLGTWGSLHAISDKDYVGNAVVGSKNVFAYDSANCMISVPQGKVVVLQGLDGYIVAESDNTLLICKLSEEQQIKQMSGDVKIKMGEKFI
mgnify:CR=1 FL=1